MTLYSCQYLHNLNVEVNAYNPSSLEAVAGISPAVPMGYMVKVCLKNRNQRPQTINQIYKTKAHRMLLLK